jgi:hypothetical protein
LAILSKRAGQPVDPAWFATALAHAQTSYPRIRIDREVARGLLEFLTWQWRQGRTPREAVAMTCASSGRILPTAGTQQPEPKVRPPASAKPGDVFGADEVRAAVKTDARIAKLTAKLADVKQRLSLYPDRIASAGPARRAELQDRQTEDLDRARTLKAQLSQAKEQARQAPLDSWRQVAKPSKARPVPARAAAPPTCPPRNAGCKLGLEGGVCGLPAPLVLASARGTPIPQVTRFCLTSADRLIASHDARRGFSRRADYPEDVQEREYERDKSEQYKVLTTAQNLIPELIFNGAPGAIDGLPVVTKEGIVLGGNGRTQAVQLHYAQGGHVAKDYLLDNAAQFGFTAEQVSAIPDPVVVRVVQAPDLDAPEFKRAAQELVRLLNVPLTQGLGVRAEALAESRRISNEVLEILSTALESGSSLAEYLSSRSARTFADALRRAGIITDRNAGRHLNPDGTFSEDGKRFAERLLTASLIPNTAILDQLGPGMVATLAAGAPWILSAAAHGEAWDLRKPMLAAAKDLADLQTRDIESVDAYLRQGGLFGKPATDGDPEAQSLLRLLYQVARQPTRFRSFAKRFAALAAQNPINQSSLFETETIRPRDALRRAIEAT